MNKKKKIMVAVVSILVAALILTGVVTVYLWQRKNKQTAQVQSVERLNQRGYEGVTSYGMVTNDYYQDVFLMDGQTVLEVYVKEGQEVKTGDKLMAYDMTLSSLKLEMQELEIQTIDNKITLAKRELERLKKETPIPEQSRDPKTDQNSDSENDGEEDPTYDTEEDPADSRETGDAMDVPKGHTAAELATAIKAKEKELRDLDLEKRRAQLTLDQMKKVAADGVVLATVDGVVKTVGDKNNPPTDGTAFLTVSGSEGLYVTGYLSEFQLQSVEIGQVVYANSWDTGASFEATIQEISLYPGDGSNSYGSGNPNVSYYPYIAYIADTEGLKNGMYVELTMNARYSDENLTAIYLEKAYVREEDGRSYVLKADENGRLVKQYVETGRTLWGRAIEIKSGLTLEDRIAFPYGKTAREGVKVKDQSDDSDGYIDDIMYH